MLEIEQRPVAVLRKDYKETPFKVDNVDLRFDIYDDYTLVSTDVTFTRKQSNNNNENACHDLILDGDETSVDLKTIKIDGGEIKGYEIGSMKLRIPSSLLPASSTFILRSRYYRMVIDNTE